MIATLEFLGMRKLIEISDENKNYKVAVPFGITHAMIMPKGEDPVAVQDQYAILVFTPEDNSRWGLPDEPEWVFTFDHLECMQRKGTNEKV